MQHTFLRRLGHSSMCAAQPPSHFHKAFLAARRKTTGTAGWSPQTPLKRDIDSKAQLIAWFVGG